MSFLLDTNVLSEPMKKARPNSGVLAWLSRVNEDEVFVSVVTITEVGLKPLPSGMGI
jgi:predicted nucleic acid-binding protein